MKKQIFKVGDVIDILLPDKRKFTCETILEIDEEMDMVRIFNQGADEDEWVRSRYCKLSKINPMLVVEEKRPKMSIINWEIAQFCGVKSVPQGSVTCNWYQVEKGNPLRILNNMLDHESNIRFDRDWNHLMAAIRYIADMEHIPLVTMLCKLAGKHGDSIEDVHENLYEYIKSVKKECPL